MNKKIIVFILFMFSFIIPINASDVTTSLIGPTNVNRNQEFVLTFKVNGNNIWGLSGVLNYDKSKFELVSSKGLSGFSATVDRSVILDSDEGVSDNFSILELKFKVLDSAVPGDTTISITNAKASTDEIKLTVSNCSKTIHINTPKSSNSYLYNLKVDNNLVPGFSKTKKSYDLGNTENSKINIFALQEDSRASIKGLGNFNLKYGRNTFKIIVTAENGSTNTYTITINKNDHRSKNNNLSKLSASPLDLKFNNNKSTYSFNVKNNIKTINIKATAADSKSKISGLGVKTLNNYANKFVITVTAENGSKKYYTIIVNREDEKGNLGDLSKDNTLKELKIEGYDLEFNSNNLNYNITVDNLVKELNITALPNDSKAIVTLNNKELKVGNNLITIDVVSESGDKKVYNINVIRKDNIPEILIDDINKKVKDIENKKVIINVTDKNNILTKDNLKTIKENQKNITVNKYNDSKVLLYSWIIDGNKLEDNTKEINTNITFDSKHREKIEKLTNYADSLYLHFDHSGKLPDSTRVRIYVGNNFSNNEKINIYYYDENNNSVKSIEKGINVINGYVEFEIEHCSEYIFTRAILNNMNPLLPVVIIESILILALLLVIIINKTKKKKHSKKKLK